MRTIAAVKDRQWFVLYVLVCLEVGVFLLLVPWSIIWGRNYFLQVFPEMSGVMLHPIVRGAVSGLGAANLYVGLGEVWRRRTAPSTTPEPDAERAFSPSEKGREALVTHEEHT